MSAQGRYPFETDDPAPAEFAAFDADGAGVLSREEVTVQALGVAAAAPARLGMVH